MDSSGQPKEWKIHASDAIKVATLVWLSCEVTGAIWNGLSLEMPLLVLLISVGAYALGGALFLVNVLLAGLVRERRQLHAVLLLLFVVGWALSLWMADLHAKKRHQWFVREGILEYETMAKKISQSRERLTDELKLVRLESIPSVVRAQTNADGSVTVWFPGGDRGSRHGYIYHSGAQLTAKPGNSPGAYFLHLTNSWYEY